MDQGEQDTTTATPPTPLQAVTYFKMQLNQLENAAYRAYMSDPSQRTFDAIKQCLGDAVVCTGQIVLADLSGCRNSGDCQGYQHCEDGDCVFGPPDA